MASALADQLGNTKINDGATDNAWKEKIKIPTKDSRPQTEVEYVCENDICVLTSVTGCHSNKRPGI